MWQWNRKNTDPFYEDLCNTYFHRIFLYCRRLIKGQEQLSDFAEECTQSTFLEARKQISTLKNHPNVEGWLYTTARNLINNSYRNMYIKKGARSVSMIRSPELCRNWTTNWRSFLPPRSTRMKSVLRY